ncbi:MAG: histidine phosphatase family protein [Actinomycetota bacterium]
MARVYMVRHGRAAAGWNVDPDPGLDELGRSQALAAATELVPRGAMAVVTSPLLRCRQTAFPTATAWGTEARVEPRVGEIPSPEGYSLENRVEWLREAMAGTWTQVAARSGAHYRTYRDSVAAAIGEMQTDTVVFSHFIAINAVIGAATGDDRVVIASLDNCSITVLDVSADGSFALVETGGEADTLIR